MVASTRGSAAEPAEEPEPDVGLEQLEHLVLEVCRRRGGQNNAILRACKHHGIENPYDLATYQYVDSLTYVKEGITHNLEAGNMGLIHNFKKFAGPFALRGNGVVQWTEITHEDWLQFISGVIVEFSTVNQASASGTTSVATNMPKVLSPLQEFEKGIRRDKAAYLVLKDDKAWDSWRRSTITTARTHKCEEIFDPSYVCRCDRRRQGPVLSETALHVLSLRRETTD